MCGEQEEAKRATQGGEVCGDVLLSGPVETRLKRGMDGNQRPAAGLGEGSGSGLG